MSSAGFFIRIIVLLTQCTLVFSQSDRLTLPERYYVFGVDFGITRSQNLGNSTSFPLGYSTFIYQGNNDTVSPLRFGISISKNISVSQLDAVRLGLSYHYITNMAINGLLEQGISPPYSSFTYAYKINSAQLLAEAKVLHQWRKKLYPYITGAIGSGFSRALEFKTNVPNYLTLTPYYENHATTSLSYTLGFGIDLLALQSCSLGVGYRFSNLGHISLGRGQIRNTQIASQLNQSHLYLNSVQVELNWYF